MDTEAICDHLRERIGKECDEYLRMQFSLELYRPRAVVYNAILAAYNDKIWDWHKSDGCTGVSEANFPVGFRHPVCVAHDHGCWKVRNGKAKRKDVDWNFLLGKLDYGMNPVRAYARWLGVRAHWIFYEKWKNKVKFVRSANVWSL